MREFLFLPSEGAEAVRRFARGLDEAEEVRAYARLSKDFCIPTPVGAYTPEWFVAFQDGGCCLVETRGTDARAVCAERLYAGRVPFWFAADCEELLHALNKNH